MTRIVGHAERRRLGRFAAAQHRFFDLGRADPVARALDHLVVTTDETKQAVRPLDHRIARPDGDTALPRTSRRGAKALCGAFGTVQLTPGTQRPGLDRQEERRGGKGWVSMGSLRGWKVP